MSNQKAQNASVSWQRLVGDKNYWITHELQFGATTEQEINKFTISVNVESGVREAFDMTEVDTLKGLLEILVNALKLKKGYSSSKISYKPIDVYTSNCNEYVVKWCTHKKGMRGVEEKNNYHDYIPKGWHIECEVTFREPLSMRLRNSILTVLCEQAGVLFTTEDKSNLKKAHEQFLAGNPRAYAAWTIFDKSNVSYY